jgi:hypothetical protein
VRIIAGIEASTMMSLGTCRLVMPLSEFDHRDVAVPFAEAPPSTVASIALRCSSGRPAMTSSTPPQAVVGGFSAGGVEHGAVALAQTSAKEGTFTACPKRMGSADLHHRRLEVQREEHAVAPSRRAICSPQEGVHEDAFFDMNGAVDHLAREHLRG